jgi:hypothetical protein
MPVQRTAPFLEAKSVPRPSSGQGRREWRCFGSFLRRRVVEKRRRRENLEQQRFLGCAVLLTGWSKWHKGQVPYLSLSRHVPSPSICFFRPVGGAVATPVAWGVKDQAKGIRSSAGGVIRPHGSTAGWPAGWGAGPEALRQGSAP